MSNLHIINNVHKIKEEVNGVRLVFTPRQTHPWDDREWMDEILWLEVTTPDGGLDGFSITGDPYIGPLFKAIRKMLPFVTCTKWEDVARVAVLAAMNVAEAECYKGEDKVRFVLDLLGLYYYREGDEAYMNPVHGFMANFLKGGQDGFNTPPVPEEAIDTFATEQSSPVLEDKGYRDWDDYHSGRWNVPKGGRKRRFNKGQKDTTPIQGHIVVRLWTIDTGEFVTTRSYSAWNPEGQFRTRWVPGPTVTRTYTRTIRCSSGYRKPKAVKA